MTALSTISKIYGPDMLKKYGRPLIGVLTSPLDSEGSAIKEWLFRKEKISIGAPFFKPFNDDELEELIQELQMILHKKKGNRPLSQEEKVLISAFRRTFGKLSKMNKDLI